MYARIITFQPQPGKLAELLEIVTNTAIPVMQSQPGCKLITMLSDVAANKAIAVGFWESEAQLLETEQSGLYQAQLAKVKPVLASAPTRELYAVCLQSAPI